MSGSMKFRIFYLRVFLLSVDAYRMSGWISKKLTKNFAFHCTCCLFMTQLDFSFLSLKIAPIIFLNLPPILYRNLGATSIEKITKIVKLCVHFCVCVSKILRKWTQTDTKVTFHPPPTTHPPPGNFFWSQMKGMAKIRLFYSGDMALILPR